MAIALLLAQACFAQGGRKTTEVFCKSKLRLEMPESSPVVVRKPADYEFTVEQGGLLSFDVSNRFAKTVVELRLSVEAKDANGKHIFLMDGGQAWTSSQDEGQPEVFWRLTPRISLPAFGLSRVKSYICPTSLEVREVEVTFEDDTQYRYRNPKILRDFTAVGGGERKLPNENQMVVATLKVDKRGHAELVHSDDFSSIPEWLTETLKNTKFSPTTQYGEPFQAEMRIIFCLNEEPPSTLTEEQIKTSRADFQRRVDHELQNFRTVGVFSISQYHIGEHYIWSSHFPQ